MRFGLCLCAMVMAVGSSLAAAEPPAGWENFAVWVWGGSPNAALDKAMAGQGVTGRAYLRRVSVDAKAVEAGLRPVVDFGYQGFNFLSNHGSASERINDLRKRHSEKPDKTLWVRKPCFHDPAYWARAREVLTDRARIAKALRPLHYCLDQDPSLGQYESPVEFCFGRHTLAAFRVWLKGRYKTIGALNSQWGSSFDAWDKIVPDGTDEARARADGNFSSWSDFREFMDETFAQTIARLRRIVRQADPAAVVGMGGSQMPAAFGGYDWWRLTGVLDYVELGARGDLTSHQIVESFARGRRRRLYRASAFEGKDPDAHRRRLWSLFFIGLRGMLLCPANIYFTPDGKPTALLRAHNEVVSVIRGGLMGALDAAGPAPARLAVVHCQASLRAGWQIDSRIDRATWIHRRGRYETIHGELFDIRQALCRVLTDLGVAYDFVSPEQIENFVLKTGKFQAVFLPRILAVSDKAAGAIRNFVRDGGVVIADAHTGLFDEHLKPRPDGRGALDDVFGIRQGRHPFGRAAEWPLKPDAVKGSKVNAAGRKALDLREWSLPLPAADAAMKPADGATAWGASGDAPVLLARKVGRGRALMLNLRLGHARSACAAGQAAGDLRSLFAAVVRWAGLPREAVVTAGDGAWLMPRFFGSGDLRYIALQPAEAKPAAGVVVRLDKPAWIHDVRSGKALGQINSWKLNLDAHDAAIYAVLAKPIRDGKFPWRR